MNIQQIYENYKIPPNLVRHQQEVAAVGDYICGHWTGSGIDRDLITNTLLLHDMGNIIKFKRPFLGELEKDAAYWEKVQQDFIKKYGSDVHAATLAIVRELGYTEVAQLIDVMRNVWLNPTSELSNEARICEFADCCVTPDGITRFNLRIEDLKCRYNYTEDSAPIMAARANAKIVGRSVNIKDLENFDFKIGVSGAGFDPATATL